MDNKEGMNTRNSKRLNSITPEARGQEGDAKILKLEGVGKEKMKGKGRGKVNEGFNTTPVGPVNPKEEVRKNIFGVEVEGRKVQAKLEKCKKCEDRMVCVVEQVEEGKVENIKCQECWMGENKEWERKMKEKEQEECGKCEEKQKKIDELDDKLAEVMMEDMRMRLTQTQATQEEGCKECVEKGEIIEDLQEKIRELGERGEIEEGQCEDCDRNKVKISEYEQKLREYDERRREGESSDEESEEEMEVEDERNELRSKVARLEAEREILKGKIDEGNEVVQQRNELIMNMAEEREKLTKEKDDFEEKWQVLRGKMNKIVEYWKEGGNNQEEKNEEISEEIIEVPREKVIVVGSSHMTFIRGEMNLREEDIVSANSGAGIKEIMEKAVGQAKKVKGRAVLFICGGGNSLNVLGRKITVEEVMKGLRDIKEEEDVRVVMLSILPRPSQTAVYEEARVEANLGIKDGIERLKEEGQRVEFLECDDILGEDVYEWRKVHLNREGMWRLGRRMLGKLEGGEKMEELENEIQARIRSKGGIFGEIKKTADERGGMQKENQWQRGRKEDMERMRGDSRFSNFVNKIDRGRGSGGYNTRGNRGRGGFGDRGALGRGQGNGGRGGFVDRGALGRGQGNGGRGGVGDRGALGRGQGNEGNGGRGGPMMENRGGGGRGGERGRGAFSTRGTATYGGPINGSKTNNGGAGGGRGGGSRN